MNHVPTKYRNVINPWMTPREIKNAVRFVEAMLKKLDLSPDAEQTLLCHDLNIDWSKPK